MINPATHDPSLISERAWNTEGMLSQNITVHIINRILDTTIARWLWKPEKNKTGAGTESVCLASSSLSSLSVKGVMLYSLYIIHM